MSVCAEAALPAPPANPVADARAARIAKFEREKLIVDYLNRGVSVAEIAVYLGLSEKRLRAVIREILARRAPVPPEEFIAIQVNRLNEALLVAYSAMSGMNLKAVDRVVKIVRELDRYHGFAAAERRRPEESRLAGPPQSLAFGAALVCHAEFALQEVDAADMDRLECEEAVIARPGESGDVAIQGDAERPADHGSLPPGLDPGVAGDAGDQAAGVDDRPENPAQGFEKIDSMPGSPLSEPAGSPTRPYSASPSGAPLENDGRPENPAQDPEKIDSAPGASAPANRAFADAKPGADPGRYLSMLAIASSSAAGDTRKMPV